MDWICVQQHYRYSLLWEIGDVAVCAESPGKYFVPADGLEGVFAFSGRRFLIKDGRISGVWDG